MFSSSNKIERGVENVARKIGIDPKVASKTWNTMSSYTKNMSDNFTKSRSKLLKRGTTEPRLPTHTINVKTNPTISNVHQNNLRQYNMIKYSLYCLVFFGCIILLNFIFAKHLEPKTKTLSHDTFVYITNSNQTKQNEIHLNLMDNNVKDDIEKDIDDLFNKINNNDTIIDVNHIRDREDPMLEEKSMQSLRNNIMESDMKESVIDLKHHGYHAYPYGLSDIDNGIYYIAMISDMDRASKMDKYKWRSYLQHVKLTLYNDNIEIEWIAPPFTFNRKKCMSVNDTCYTVMIDGYISEKGRGMELSELVQFNGLLYSFDDRSGIIYEISAQFEAIPRHIIMEGDGNIGKGMKIEWATYKDDEELLYIGSIGREYTNSDGTKIRKLGLLWVVTMDKYGVIQHHDWTMRYIKMREMTATLFPGYLWIEAVEWSQIHHKWFIAPRYLSFDKYDAELTEKRGCNLLIIASEDFSNIDLVWIKFKSTIKRMDKMDRSLLEDGFKSVYDLNAAQLRSMSVKQENFKLYLQHSTKGFSTIRFLPSTNDTVIVAIRTQENDDKEITDSFLCIFDIYGNVYLETKRIPFQKKYEGLVIL